MQRGIDISSWQNGLNLASLKEQGVEFAILKIGEGRTVTDECFGEFYRAAWEAGIPVGAYYFSHATTEQRAVDEAKRALALADGRPLPLGIYMDVESSEQLALSDSALTAVVKAFCDTIRAGGYRPGAYGSAGQLWAKVGPAWLGEDVLVWVAAWSKSPPSMGDVWQFSDSLRFAGFTGYVDGDQALSERFEQMISAGKDTNVPTEQELPTAPKEDTFSLFGVPTLRNGDTGPAVKALQGEMIAAGYRCGGHVFLGVEKPDGIFGNKTEASIREIQRAHNITETGVADAATRSVLIRAGGWI